MSAGGQATGDLLTIVDVSEAAAADKNKKMTMENLFKGIPGDVGINVSSPASNLHVKGNDIVQYVEATGTAAEICFRNNTSTGDNIRIGGSGNNLTFDTGGSESARIDSSGRLLLGTSTARAVGGETNPRLHIEGVGASSNSWVNISRYVSSSGGPAIQLAKSRGTSGGSYTVVQSGDTLGTLGFLGSDGTDLATYGAKITGEVDGTPGSNDMPGRLVFSTTADGASSPTERVRITNLGAVGIGVTSPALGASNTPALDVNGPILASGPLAAHQTGKGVLQRSGNVIALRAYGETAGTGQIAFNTGGGGGSTDSEVARIDAGGKLLIGTSTARTNFLNSSFTAFFQVEGTGHDDSAISMVRNSNNTGSPYLNIGKSRGSGVNGNTVVQSGDGLGVISFQGTDGSEMVEAAAIIAQVDGTPGANDMPGRLIFSTTADGASGSTERLRIDSSGNLGVGVTPDDWGGSRKAIQFDSAGAAYLCNDSSMGVVSNMYFDGSNDKYINAGSASAFYVQNDNIVFNFAGSGSADANASFVRSVRIDSDGLKFGSDTAAANALDDYEEGTWTPTATNYSGTISVNSASYVKIGQLCFVHAYISFSNTTDGDIIILDGLPFTAFGINNNYYMISAHTNAGLQNFALRAQGTTTELTAIHLSSGDGDAKPTYTSLASKFIIFGGCFKTT